MIDLVDEALKSLIGTAPVIDGVEVALDAPNSEWASRRNAPTVNIFLYDIREDVTRRDVAPRVVKEKGRVVGREAAPRRFRLSYLATAWTQDPTDEHRLLSALLGLFLQHDHIPDQYVPPALTDHDLPILLELARPPSADRSISDIWSALGGALKPSLEITVIAPLDPLRSYETGPPVLEEPRIQVEPMSKSDSAALKKGAAANKKAKRAPLGADELGGSGIDVLQAGTERLPGRTILARQGIAPRDAEDEEDGPPEHEGD